MKLKELKELFEARKQQIMESPFMHGGNYMDNVSKGEYSINTLKREFNLLGFLEIEGDLVEICIRKATPHVIGVIVDNDKVRTIFSLRFKTSPTISKNVATLLGNNILQVSSAYVDEDFRHGGIASFAYAQLVKHGYVVISDSEQFTDGAELWKKMARKAEVKNYSVYILDADYGFVEEDGKPIVYDGSNISDAKIWSGDDDFAGYNILLVMK